LIKSILEKRDRSIQEEAKAGETQNLGSFSEYADLGRDN
jgi:hypothetical protein